MAAIWREAFGRSLRDKLADNARKYPADRVRGSAKKYSDYPDETS